MIYLCKRHRAIKSYRYGDAQSLSENDFDSPIDMPPSPSSN
jgi:hypothetical protein